MDTQLPAGGTCYNRVTNGLGTQSLWPALAEKAYAEANTLGLVGTHNAGMGSYDSMNGGNPCLALPAITGSPETWSGINTSNIASAWNSGQIIVLASGTANNGPPTSSLIEGDHFYALVGYNTSNSQPFQIYNPWGTLADGYAPWHDQVKYGLFTANATFVSQNYTEQDLSAGAANTSLLPTPTDNLSNVVDAETIKPRKVVVKLFNPSPVRDRLSVGMATVDGPRTW